MTDDRTGIEQEITSVVIAARWIMAPMYLGVIIALAILTFVFCREVLTYIPQLMSLTQEGAFLMALSVIELALAANLLFVTLSIGYQSFIASSGTGKGPSANLFDLKSKLIAALILFAGLNLLKRLIQVAEGTTEYSTAELFWFIAVFASFVIAWVVLMVAANFAKLTDRPEN